MDTNNLRRKTEELEGEVEELRAKVERYEAERRAAGRVATRAGGFAALVFLGPGLVKAVRDYLRKAKAERDPLPVDETAAVAGAVFGRFVRVGVVGLVVGALPIGLLLWQNFLIRAQVNQQAADTLIVRRAQLLEIIYAEECERPEMVRLVGEILQRIEASPGDEGGGETSADSGETGVEAEPEGKAEDPRCWPKAPIRARQEAALAFIEIEWGRRVKPNLRRADLGGADLSLADLSGVDLIDADLSGAYLFGTKFRGAMLRAANLRGANLRAADLNWANLSGADLHAAALGGADLRGAVLRGSPILTARQLESTFGDAYTQLRKDRERPEHWQLPYAEQRELLKDILEAGPVEIPGLLTADPPESP